MSEKPISPLRQRMIEDMSVRNFVEKTRNDYIKAVVLDFVHPFPPNRRSFGCPGKARRDEARRKGTQPQRHSRRS